MKMAWVVCALFLFSSMFFSLQLCADTITFSDIVTVPYDTGTVPNGYAGYQWQNVSVFRSTGCAGVKYEYTSTGYCHLTDAIGDEDQAYLFGRYGTTVLGTLSSDQPFSLNAGVFAAAWNNDVVMTVIGYRNGVEMYSTSFLLNTGYYDCQPGAPPFCRESTEAFPFVIDFGWQDVDTVTFQGVGGHSDGVGSVLFPDDYQANVIIGSLDISPCDTPEPTSCLLAGSGFVAAGSIGRRYFSRGRNAK